MAFSYFPDSFVLGPTAPRALPLSLEVLCSRPWTSWLLVFSNWQTCCLVAHQPVAVLAGKYTCKALRRRGGGLSRKLLWWRLWSGGIPGSYWWWRAPGWPKLLHGAAVIMLARLVHVLTQKQEVSVLEGHQSHPRENHFWLTASWKTVIIHRVDGVRTTNKYCFSFFLVFCRILYRNNWD